MTGQPPSAGPPNGAAVTGQPPSGGPPYGAAVTGQPPSAGPPDGAAVDRCGQCGGAWTAGRLAVPIVGSLRFVYRLGSTEVSTEVAADLCARCGHVRLRARDPELIERAHRAGSAVRGAPRWGLGKRRPDAADPGSAEG